MKLVVSDASPINYLVLIQSERILPALFTKIVLPRVVWLDELQHANAPESVRAWAWALPDWIEVQEPVKPVAELGLDAGETQAIALALELGCPILLDEREARTVAREAGLRVLGLVGVLEEAAARGSCCSRASGSSGSAQSPRSDKCADRERNNSRSTKPAPTHPQRRFRTGKIIRRLAGTTESPESFDSVSRCC